nr:GspH/FimT family pseudopilin [candidate division Zixibacteria bacterium]
MKKIFGHRGITILELLSTVVIIGIVAAMAVPQFDKSIKRIQFRGKAKDVVSYLRLARSMAISEKNPYGLYFDSDAKTVSIFRDIANLTAETYDAGGDSVIQVDTLPVNFTYLATTFANSSIVFRPNGSASGSGNIDIQSQCDADNVYNSGQISVLAATGKSRLEYINNY